MKATLREVVELNGLKRDPYWAQRSIYRPLSLVVTWISVNLSLSANTITVLSLFLTVAAAFLLLTDNTYILILSAFLIQAGYLLDYVDGAVSRYYRNKGRNESSPYSGGYMDCLVHDITSPLLFFFLGMNLYFEFNYLVLLYLTALFTVAFSPIATSNKNYFILKMIRESKGNYQNIVSVASESWGFWKMNETQQQNQPSSQFIYKIGFIIHSLHLQASPVVFIPLTIILDIAFKPFEIAGIGLNFKMIYFFMYGIVLVMRLPVSIVKYYKYLNQIKL